MSNGSPVSTSIAVHGLFSEGVEMTAEQIVNWIGQSLMVIWVGTAFLYMVSRSK